MTLNPKKCQAEHVTNAKPPMNAVNADHRFPCPKCQVSIQLDEQSSLDDLVCPGCRESVRFDLATMLPVRRPRCRSGIGARSAFHIPGGRLCWRSTLDAVTHVHHCDCPFRF